MDTRAWRNFVDLDCQGKGGLDEEYGICPGEGGEGWPAGEEELWVTEYSGGLHILIAVPTVGKNKGVPRYNVF